MWFHARFKAPTLDFLCNHEALVHVNIEEGHLNLEHVRASDETAADRYVTLTLHTTNVAEIHISSRNQNLSNISVTFRVPFKISRIEAWDTITDGSENVTSMLVLDYEGTGIAVR